MRSGCDAAPDKSSLGSSQSPWFSALVVLPWSSAVPALTLAPYAGSWVAPLVGPVVLGLVPISCPEYHLRVPHFRLHMALAPLPDSLVDCPLCPLPPSCHIPGLRCSSYWFTIHCVTLCSSPGCILLPLFKDQMVLMSHKNCIVFKIVIPMHPRYRYRGVAAVR